jgi:hypothetical protein
MGVSEIAQNTRVRSSPKNPRAKSSPIQDPIFRTKIYHHRWRMRAPMTGMHPFHPTTEGEPMSFHTSAHSPGVFVPDELAMLQNMLNDMRRETWFPRSQIMQEKFASFIIRTYDRGVTCPEKLKAYCAIAARLHFFEVEAAN